MTKFKYQDKAAVLAFEHLGFICHLGFGIWISIDGL
jgi:hypothetical protein